MKVLPIIICNGDGNIDIITIGDHGNPGIQSGEQGFICENL